MSINEKTGIKIFGIINVIFGAWFLITFALGFFMGVLLGWVTDSGFHSAYDGFMSLIVGRSLSDINYIFSFLLFSSGLDVLSMKKDGRKLAILSIAVVSSTLLVELLLAIAGIVICPDIIFSPYRAHAVSFLIFMAYAIFAIIYLSKPKIKELFNDKNVKLSLKIPIIIIIVAFVCPLFLKYLVLFIGTYFMK